MGLDDIPLPGPVRFKCSIDREEGDVGIAIGGGRLIGDWTGRGLWDWHAER